MTDRNPLPEVRTILERARSNRHILDALLDQVPSERWDNRAEGDQWTARTHLAHLATIDAVTIELLMNRAGDEIAMDNRILAERIVRMNEVAEIEVDELRALMHDSRARINGHLSRFDEDSLAASVAIEMPGAYPPRQTLSLRAYLASWAEHDTEHSLAIREAVTAPLQPSALSAAQRIRRLGRDLS